MPPPNATQRGMGEGRVRGGGHLSPPRFGHPAWHGRGEGPRRGTSVPPAIWPPSVARERGGSAAGDICPPRALATQRGTGEGRVRGGGHLSPPRFSGHLSPRALQLPVR